MRLWAFAVVCVALAGCFGPEDSDSDAGSADAAAGDGGSGGGGAGSGGGGAGSGGGAGVGGSPRDGGFHVPDANMTFDGGHAPDSGSSGVCNLPADTGPCDGAFSRWAWNPMVGACELFSYGGCDGNGNNFENPSECLESCASVPVTGPGAHSGCKVGDQVFPSGAGGIKDPHSCNTCSCVDGQLEGCTEIGCSQECPPNAGPSTSCAACGPADGCEIVEHGCFVVCSDDSVCAGTEFPFCISGLCRNLCG